MLSRRALLFIRRRDILIIKIYTLLPRLMICEFKSNVDDKKKKILHLHSFYRKEMKDVCKKKLHFIWLKIWNYE